MLKEVDAFLAKHVFHPPAILYAQYTERTIYQTSRDIHFVAWMLAAAASATAHPFAFLYNAYFAYCAYQRTKYPAYVPEISVMAVRFLLLSFIPLAVFMCLATSMSWLFLFTTIFWSMSEYAKTIDYIPPRKRKRKLVKKPA